MLVGDRVGTEPADRPGGAQAFEQADRLDAVGEVRDAVAAGEVHAANGRASGQSQFQGRASASAGLGSARNMYQIDAAIARAVKPQAMPFTHHGCCLSSSSFAFFLAYSSMRSAHGSSRARIVRPMMTVMIPWPGQHQHGQAGDEHDEADDDGADPDEDVAPGLLLGLLLDAGGVLGLDRGLPQPLRAGSARVRRPHRSVGCVDLLGRGRGRPGRQQLTSPKYRGHPAARGQ